MLIGKRWRFRSIGTSALPVNSVFRFVLIKRWKSCSDVRTRKQKIASFLSSLPLSNIIKPGGGERQSGSKALECGSFRLWEANDCMKLNVFIPLACLNANGQRLPPCLRRSGFAQAGLNLFHPTASLLFPKNRFFSHCDRRGRVRGL